MSPYPSTLQLSPSVCLHVLCVLLLLTDLSCAQIGKNATLPEPSTPPTKIQGDRVGAASKQPSSISLPSTNSTSQGIHDQNNTLNKSVISSIPPTQPTGGKLSHSYSQDTVTKPATSLPPANTTKASSAGTNTSTGTTTSTTTVSTTKTTVHVTTPAKTTPAAATTTPLAATITPPSAAAKTTPLVATATPPSATATTPSATATTPSAETDPKPTTKGPKPTAQNQQQILHLQQLLQQQKLLQQRQQNQQKHHAFQQQ
ncbi:salivary glue protein Sgs-3 [Scomber scombrus]|uniref:Salivary glue protein Sgs-3 n=1 Tax=Scomber scombrus TaxID=13677 RepID=A0AAV1P3I9_SCOSC